MCAVCRVCAQRKHFPTGPIDRALLFEALWRGDEGYGGGIPENYLKGLAIKAVGGGGGDFYTSKTVGVSSPNRCQTLLQPPESPLPIHFSSAFLTAPAKPHQTLPLNNFLWATLCTKE